MKKIIFIGSFLILIIWIGCTRATFVQEDLNCQETIRYDVELQPILTTYCAYSGCHDGSVQDAVDYTTYTGMSTDFGSMFDRVVTQIDNPFTGMPRDDGDGPDNMTEEDFRIFSCWIEQDFPEN